MKPAVVDAAATAATRVQDPSLIGSHKSPTETSRDGV